MQKLRETSVNPIAVLVVVLIIVAALGYAFIIRPGQVQAKIEKDWSTPEAAAARREGKPKPPEAQALLDQLRAKEGATSGARHVRRRDRE